MGYASGPNGMVPIKEGRLRLRKVNRLGCQGSERLLGIPVPTRPIARGGARSVVEGAVDMDLWIYSQAIWETGEEMASK